MRTIKTLTIISLFWISGIVAQVTTDPTPPKEAVKLVMIHASIGRAWLCDGTDFGHLGGVLGANNYYVSDCDKDFDAPQNENVFNNGYPNSGVYAGAIYNWFYDTTTAQGNGYTKSENVLNAIYTTTNAYSVDPVWMTYKRDYMDDPGGENTIVMFKPTHVSSGLKSNNSSDWTELIGKHPSDDAHTIANSKEIFNKIVEYFKTRTDKMFVLITPPPYAANTSEDAFSQDETLAANARELNTWFVNNWLQDLDWENKNVYVFDFFNVITDPNNHHRVIGEAPNYSIEYVTSPSSSNFGYAGYYADPTNSHPQSGGSEGSAGVKGSEEFAPLLNVYYNRYIQWKDGTNSIYNALISGSRSDFKIEIANSAIHYLIPESYNESNINLKVYSLKGSLLKVIKIKKNIGKVNLKDLKLSKGSYVISFSNPKTEFNKQALTVY